jgi:hypothetical protein
MSGAENVNTAAVILEATLFTRRGGRPLLEPGGAAPVIPGTR